MESDELEKIWICRSCLHEFVPFRNKYACPECHSDSTFSTKNDSKIKKSETHTNILPQDPYLIISEKTEIEGADIESVYERCLSWLKDKDAEITGENPPIYLTAIHFPGGVHITEYQKELRIKLTSSNGDVVVGVEMWRLIDPREIMYRGWGRRPRPSERWIHRDKLVEIARYREYWGILLQGLYTHIGIEESNRKGEQT